MQIGNKIPSFNLEGVNEKGKLTQYTNTDFIGKNLIIYFYPKDDTSSCTLEAKKFNIMLPNIASNTNIIGISADSEESHIKFQTKYGLNFPLLIDKDASFAKAMNSSKEDLLNKIIGLKIARKTFLVNKVGEVVHVWNNVDVSVHDAEVLEQLNKLV